MSKPALARALGWLDEYGILLVVDPLLPSVTTAVTGQSLKGSWWGHPQSHAIFAVVERLEGYRRALQTKLVSGKVTFVHARLWPALAGAASAREPWQIEGLSADENDLFGRVQEAGWVRTDEPEKLAPLDPRSIRTGAKRLEKALLVVAREVHTPTGAHAKVIESWEGWASRIGFRESWRPVAEGKRELEEAMDAVNRAFDANGRLPWQRS